MRLRSWQRWAVFPSYSRHASPSRLWRSPLLRNRFCTKVVWHETGYHPPLCDVTTTSPPWCHHPASASCHRVLATSSPHHTATSPGRTANVTLPRHRSTGTHCWRHRQKERSTKSAQRMPGMKNRGGSTTSRPESHKMKRISSHRIQKRGKDSF